MAIVARRITANGIKALRITASRISAVVSAFVCRWFSNFNGVDSYAQFTSDIVLNGDFSLEFDLMMTDTVGSQKLFDNTNSDDRMDLSIVDGVLVSRAYGVWTVDGGAPTTILSDVMYKMAFTRTVSDPDQSTRIIMQIGARYTFTNFLNGQLSNLKITDQGTQIVNMPMDERYLDIHGEIIYNNLASQDLWYLSFPDNQHLSSLMLESITIDEFEYEIDLLFSDLSQENQQLLAHPTSPISGLFVESGGSIRFRSDAEVSFGGGFTSTTLIPDNTRVVLIVKRDAANLITVNVIGVGSDSATYAGVMTFDMMFRKIGDQFPLHGNVYSTKLWMGGDRNTGTKVIDYDFQSLSNVIPNAASTTSANLWVGTRTATGESSIVDANTINVLRTNATNSQVSVVAAVIGLDVLIEVTVIAGSLDNIICGDTTTEFTGWENVRDVNQQPIPNRFQTLMNNNDAEILFKTNGIANVLLTEITSRTVTGYGVASGDKDVDWAYGNDSPNARGFNITTEQDPTCAAENITFNGEEITFNNENITF